MNENQNICLHYILGVSIGSMMEPTAIAIIEQETRVRDGFAAYTHALRLRHLERVPLDTRYPVMVDQVGELIDKLKKPEQDDATDRIVDTTGTGRSVGDLMVKSGLKPHRVTITNGTGEDETKLKEWRLAKVELVGGLQVTLQSDRLEMAAEIELVPTLVEELRNFKLRPPTINVNDPESWREGQFDDLVFAVGLANWRANRDIPHPGRVAEWEPIRERTDHAWMG